ncbi:NHLP bacteriocin export ABC transporter permease/ATPase subunit [candidate division KSB1 bacterium]|nr:NHLP bacteriocin export ABC transporter permease/ATPase subunit [candidate division KSB1 bacterium]
MIEKSKPTITSQELDSNSLSIKHSVSATHQTEQRPIRPNPTNKPINTIRELFEYEGSLSIVGGNTPFLLDDENSLWYIRSGKVEIFSVQVSEGKPHGSRNHFFSAVAGQILFGMNINEYGLDLGLLAVGIHNTHLYRLDVNRLRQMAAHPAMSQELADMVNHWVSGLSLGLSKNIELRTDVLLEPNLHIELEDGKKIRSKKGVLWIKYSAGTPLFIGMEKLPIDGTDILFPISYYTWLQMVGNTNITSVSTESAIAQDAAWHGMKVMYELLFRCEYFNTRLMAVDEFNLSKRKIDQDRRMGEIALNQLAAVLENKPLAPISKQSENALLEACKAVGQSMGLTITAPSKQKERSKTTDPLSDICRVSRVRCRQVILKDGWWGKDNGPLLGFIVDDKKPVALLPASSTNYECYDPSTGVRMPILADNAASIAPQAFMFYRPFPDKIMNAKEMLKFSVQDCKKELLIIPLMGIAGGLITLIIPILTGMIFSNVIPGADRNQLVQIAVAILVGALSVAAFQITRSIATLRLEGKMARNVQAAVWDRLMKLPTPFFRQFTSGDLANRAMGIDAIREFLSGATITTILGSIFSIFNFFLLFYYSWKLALAASIIVLIAIIMTAITGYFDLKYFRPLIEINNKISGELFQFISAITKLRIAGAEIRSFSSWVEKFTVQKRLAFKTRLLSNNVVVFNSMLPILASLTIFASLALYRDDVMLMTGNFLAFSAAFSAFLAGTLEFSSTMISILKVVPIYENAAPILETLPEVDTTKSDPGELNGRIEISHVSFRYKADGPLILNDVSLEINPGEFVAFVGPSGSGKSTILRLLLGFEEPQRGAILYDGQDLSTLDITSVRKQIGTVLQNGKLMSGDIYTNIVGNAPLTVDDAWVAARMAGLDEDIKYMPMGMHTVVSEGGTTFSGGQRQRLLIARAIVHKPKMIFFDEATSALDNRTQTIVSKSLENLQATRIVIAHRLSTVVNANRIYVIKVGKIVESGTYDELMNLNGTFAEIAKRQIV